MSISRAMIDSRFRNAMNAIGVKHGSPFLSPGVYDAGTHFIVHNTHYGYSIARIETDGGGESSPFGIGYSAKEFMAMLEGVIQGAKAMRAAAPAQAAPADDGRRVVVTFHSNSSNPRGKRWWHIAEVCQFDDGIFLHRDYVGGDNAKTKADAVAAAKRHAAETGFAYLPGVYIGSYGERMSREA